MHKLQASKIKNQIKKALMQKATSFSPNNTTQAEEKERIIHKATRSWVHYKPRCFYRPRFSPQQGRGLTHFYLGRSSAEKTQTQASKTTRISQGDILKSFTRL